MQTLLDFFTFKILITPYLLVFCYAFGAILVPLLSWFITLWLKRKFKLFSDVVDQGIETTIKYTQGKHRLIVYAIAVFIFISLEIMWRIMFEFFVVYFQINDSLLLLTIK